MIWSLIKNVARFFLPEIDSYNTDDGYISEDEEKNVLSEINDFRSLDTHHLEIDDYEVLLGHTNTKSSNLKTDNYLYKTGTVTFLCKFYGLIDDKYYFDIDSISPNLVVNKNDIVAYVINESTSDEPGKVLKICTLSNACWDPYGTQDINEDCDWSKKFEAVQRILNGKVTQLKDKKFFVDPHNIWCHMDKVEISFEPTEGDWVSVEASVSVDYNVPNLEGEVLEVVSVKPSMIQNGTGRVTFWVDGKNEGVINNTIVFDSSVCVDFYIPSLGDLVSYEAIESDQGKFKWRGLWVKPDKLKLRKSKDKKIFKDKRGIVVTQSLDVMNLKFEETKEIDVDVFNKGQVDRVLVKIKMYQHGTGVESQLRLKSPNLTDKYTLKPKEKLTFVVIAIGKCLGSTGEILEFQFEKFRIAKAFDINVIPNDCVKEITHMSSGRQNRQKRAYKRITAPIGGDVVLYGHKPYTNNRFYKGPPKENFDVPKTLWRLLVGPTEVPKSTAEAVVCLRESLPYLACTLSPDNYIKRFRTLLHLEEVAIKVRFTAYSMNAGKFEKKDDYWFLEVSGLAEGRPSILQGDKVVVTKPWVNKITHIGFVHKTECNGIYVDFHPAFSRNKMEENCEVKFVPNIKTIVRCHQALGKCFTTLGKDWFFPSRVIEKPDRISFEVADGPVIEGLSSGVKKEKKTLVWNNKVLNDRQKMAVINVLKGRARPLPYIVFGPPGTGKTTTLLEMIIQVTSLMSNSRVLICGPSNSCVDLITERLIDSGLYKVGELIRLYAISRLQHISEKVKPYMDSVGLSFEASQAGNKIKGARVTLGTFSTIGGLRDLTTFEHHTFTHIFIDEAAQMTEPETMIPVCFFTKDNSQLILAGDPKQLGPVCTSLVAVRFDFEISFLERLMSGSPYKANRKSFPKTSGFDPRLVTKLIVNHRSLPEIVELPNQLFYDADLVPLLSSEDSYEAELLKRIDLRTPSRDKPPAIIFHGVLGKNLQSDDSPSWYNPQEISQLVIYLKKIYQSGLTADDVGIVTPYIKQVQKCRSVLESVNMSVPQIGTVNNFQGQEKHVIILSAVRSCVKVLKNDILFSLGFVASPRRLNVALTRARTLLIILGNPNLLRLDPYWERVIDYCVKNKSYVGCNIKQTMKFKDSIDKDEGDSESGEDISKDE